MRRQRSLVPLLWVFAVTFPTPIKCVDQVSVSVGQNALLPCHVEISGSIQVAWKDKDLTTLTLNSEVFTDDRRFSVQHKYQNDWDLQIAGVKLTDAGNFTCCVVINRECQTVKLVTLAIQIPPTITSISSDVSLMTGDNTTLVCNATGVPQPTLKWLQHRTNGSIKEVSTNGIYQIRNPQKTDAGSYECVANNSAPPAASRYVQVTVIFKPEVTVPYREVRQTLHSDTLLECLITSIPLDECYWEKNGQKLRNVPGRYSISQWKGRDDSETIFGLSVYDLQADDFTGYTCVAKNKLGAAMESVLISAWHNGTLRILSAPKDVMAQAGQNVVIDCTVEGMAQGDQLIWWRYDPSTGRYIKLFDSVTTGGRWSENVGNKIKYSIVGQYNLVVKFVNMDDAGSYVCHVTNLGNYSAVLTVVLPDSSIGSGCGALSSSTPIVVTIAIVVSLIGAFIIAFIVIVFAIVRHYRKQLTKRRHEYPAVVKTERYSSISPDS